MNGNVLRELPIAVDYFSVSSQIQLYFLTHVHADHTVGLTKSWKEKIHCSPISAKLLHFKIGVEKRFIVPLEELQPHVLRLKTEKEWIFMSVTVIPANHCPGSSMLLFETEDVRILHTGDFRPDGQMYEVGKTLWGPTHRSIDVLYLDNTYCEPACVFPPRENAIEEIVKLCKIHQDCTVFIGVNWTGHEDLLQSIAVELEQYIVVPPKHLELLRLLEVKNVFSTDKNTSNIHVLPSHLVSLRHLEEIDKSEDCVGILPTAKLSHSRNGVFRKDLLYTVPYSNHSSFTELWEFVKTVCPAKVKPIVPARTNTPGMESQFRADMSQFDCLLSKKNNQSSSEESKFPTVLDFDLNSELPTLDSPKKRKRKALKLLKVKSKDKKPCGVIFDDDD